MAASRSMLESLLARVRQRAAEPRQSSTGVAPAAVASVAPRAELVSEPVAAPTAPPEAHVLDDAAEEESVEEYDEELIEIIDDGEVASESAPAPPPIELRASAPSVEMRRRAVEPSERPNGAAPASATPMARVPMPAPVTEAPRGAPPSAERGAPSGAPLRAEAVAPRPVSGQNVVQSHGTRADARTASFVELLDASLELGR